MLNVEEDIPTIQVRTLADGVSAVGIDPDNRSQKFRIAEVTLGMGKYRKTIKYEKGFFAKDGIYKAQILKNGKIRII